MILNKNAECFIFIEKVNLFSNRPYITMCAYFLFYFLCLLTQFQGSRQELSKYIKELLKNLHPKKVLYYLNSCLNIDVINFICVIKCFSSNVIKLISTKNLISLIFFSFFVQILQIFMEIIFQGYFPTFSSIVFRSLYQ